MENWSVVDSVSRVSLKWSLPTFGLDSAFDVVLPRGGGVIAPSSTIVLILPDGLPTITYPAQISEIIGLHFKED